ncbi:MAG: hypothetical protein DI586_09560, partial [Micavibrio aeruginosavorus]
QPVHAVGQLHHDLARYYIDAERKCHIDFLCLNYPEYWNETAALNNTSRHLDALYNKGQADAKDWILNNGHAFGQKSSFTPSSDLLRFIQQPQELRAA